MSGPATHHVSSLFDNFNQNFLAVPVVSWYKPDGRILASNGQQADRANGVVDENCYNLPVGQTPATLWSLFNYQGVTACPINPPNQRYLNYDNHPGYDYKASCGTELYAPVSGVVDYGVDTRGDRNGASGEHALAIRAANGWIVRLLHLSSYPVTERGVTQIRVRTPSPTGSCTKGAARNETTCATCPKHGDLVSAGQLVGYVGDFNRNKWGGEKGTIAAHLHFEVLDPNMIPRDPYGWQGSPQLAPPFHNSRLWLAPPPSPTILYQRDLGVPNTAFGFSIAFNPATAGKASDVYVYLRYAGNLQDVDVIRFLDSSTTPSTALDCSTGPLTYAQFGADASATGALVHLKVTGTQCDLVAGRLYSIKADTHGAGASCGGYLNLDCFVYVATGDIGLANQRRGS